jgi:hypothetical protein
MTCSSPARALLLAAGLISTGAPRVVRAESADDVETARAYFVEASKLGNQGRWREAREMYARSLQLKPAPLTRYSLGVAQRETGRLAEALQSFRAFLSEPATPATTPYIAPATSAIAAIEAGVGRVTIAVEPLRVDGLTLTIDGNPAPAVSEGPREMDPGLHEVVARAPGFRAAKASFMAVAGSAARVALALVPLPGTAPVVAVRGDSQAPAPVAEASGPEPERPSTVLPIVLMGAGAGLCVGGVSLGLVGVRQASEAPTRDGPDASAARAKGIAGDVIAGAGIVAAGVGLLVLLTSGRSRPTTARVGLWARGATAGVEAHFGSTR